MEDNRIFLEKIPETGFRLRHMEQSRLDYPMHYHPHMELWYCHEGTFLLHTEQQAFVMQPGSLALIPPLAIHRFACQEFCRCTYLHIAEDIYLHSEAARQPCCYADTDPPGDILSSFRQLCACLEAGDLSLSRPYATILLTLCFRRCNVAETSPEGKNTPLLRKLLTHIQDHCRESLTLECLSREFGIGKSSLSRLLNTDLQSSLPELVNRYRMLEAEQLLLHTQLSITQIACCVGYGSPCGFNRHFQKHFGLSPRDYRKSNKNPPVAKR